MAQRIKNPAHFRAILEELSKQRRVFVYVLFDERASQQKVGDFLDERFEWLNSLANASNVYILFFCRGKIKGVDKVVQAVGDVQNPSLQVAQLFDINPNELPGIVIFSVYKQFETISRSLDGREFSDALTRKKWNHGYSLTKGIFIPLKNQLFSEDSNHLEEVFADLFSILQKHRSDFIPENSKKWLDYQEDHEINAYYQFISEELVEGIRKDVIKLQRREQFRPFGYFLKGSVKSLSKIPNEFLISLATSFGAELAKKMTGKP